MRRSKMDLIQAYFDLQEQVYKHFGYVEDWVNIPLVDERDKYWILHEDKNDDGKTYGGSIDYYDTPLADGYGAPGDYYNASIYTQRFLPKWVYRAEDYTMVCMNTHTDGNRYIGIFDNTKEQKDIVA